MASVWIYSLVSVLLISLISLIGIITLGVKRELLHKVLLLLVSFSAGALIGGAFFHLIPEAFEKLANGLAPLLIVIGILVFFILEKFIHWRHCHIPTSETHQHPLATMNLIGDGLHNFIDGMIIAASYMIDFRIGLTATIAVALHEIPQEMGDFGVLVYGGFKRAKALLVNFMTALTAVLGAIVALVIGTSVESFAVLLLPIAAGGFIYIAGSDLIPELHKECGTSKSITQFLSLVLGIALMYVLMFLE